MVAFATSACHHWALREGIESVRHDPSNGGAGVSTIKALDGLRGVAALIVMLSHFNLVVPRFLGGAVHESGHAGVMIFFILSGFLMGMLYLGAPPSRRAVAQFLVHRGARIIPLYLAVILACVVIATIGPDRAWVYSLYRWETLLSHLLLIRGEGVLWTVPVEIQFYLLVPLIWLALGKAPRATIIGLIVAIAAIYLARLAYVPPDKSIAGRLMIGLPYFLAGLVLSRCVTPMTGGRWWDVGFVAAAGSLLLLYPNLVPQALLGGGDYWLNPVSLLLAALLLIASQRSRLAEHVLGSRPLRFLGQISYGIYLLHFLAIVNLSRFATLYPKTYLLFALSLVVVIAAATLAHILIERPARAAINRWFDRARQVPPDTQREPTFERAP
jgi:peptidoglycan/LPS O-acetylase OafA/YrhL